MESDSETNRDAMASEASRNVLKNFDILANFCNIFDNFYPNFRPVSARTGLRAWLFRPGPARPGMARGPARPVDISNLDSK